MLLAGQEKNTHTIFIDDRGRNTPKPMPVSTFNARVNYNKTLRKSRENQKIIGLFLAQLVFPARDKNWK